MTPSRGINRSPEAMRELAAALSTYSRDVERAGKTFRSRLTSADWHDGQKDRFAESFEALQKAIDSFLRNDVEQMRKHLVKDAARLDEILRARMG